MMWAGRISRVAHIVGMSGGRSQVDGRAGERYRDQLRVIGVDKRRIQRIFLAVRRTSSVSGEHWTGRRSRRLYIGSHVSGIGAGEAGGTREAVLAPDGRPVALCPRRRVAWGPPGVGGRVWTGSSASRTPQSAAHW